MSRAHLQQGASLIEVLVALLLVAVTMLGLLGLQLKSMGMQKDSLDRRNAALLVANFADRIAGNFDGANGGAYSGTTAGGPARSMGVTDSPPDASAMASLCNSGCTGAQIGERDWALLQTEVRNRLPGGVVDVRLGDGEAGIVVTVGWLDLQRETQEAEALKDTRVDVDKDGMDDACEAIGVSDKKYRCYQAVIFP